AHAWTVFPPDCLTDVKAANGPDGLRPVSSSNSLRAASNKSSSGSASPLGIDHAPWSLLRKNGPPGWTSSTWARPLQIRYINNPALTRGINSHLAANRVSASSCPRYSTILTARDRRGTGGGGREHLPSDHLTF